MHLRQGLPQAICDENTVSRAPSFARSSQTQTPSEFVVRMDTLTEDQIISFLMEDSLSLVAAPDLMNVLRVQGFSKVSLLKKRVALEVCTAAVSPGGGQKIVEERPGLFFTVKPYEGKMSRGTEFVLRDVENRFGYQDGKWWLAGWLEPHEVVEVRTRGRIYRRMANPITNQLHFVQLVGKEGIPLGYFRPTTGQPALTWKSLNEGLSEEISMKKRVEMYRRLVENEAYRMIRLGQEHAEKVKNLQDFYKNLMAAYQIDPENWRFSQPAVKRKKKSKSSRKLANRSLLDQSFFDALSASRTNGVKVSLIYFPPDARLHSIYLEYRDRLERLVKN